MAATHTWLAGSASASAAAQERSTCPVCDTVMRGPRAGFRFDCPRCGMLRAALPVCIGAPGANAVDDEKAFDASLASVRWTNFARVLDGLQRHVQKPGAALLEVGCAYGWFLEAAIRRGFRAHGIEPEGARASRAAARAGPQATVWRGFFPDDVPAHRTFDAIVFNDVFEHLPNVRAAVAGIDRLLSPGGVVAVNLPSSRGVFYRVAAALCRAGFRRPHDRMWQAGFPSPHLSYFHPDALTRLFERHGFVEVERTTLLSFAIKGLWARLRYDRQSSVAFSALAWTMITLAAPLLRRLPADISLQLFQRRNAG
jgi:SAM-dependent methyltransferase